MEHHSDAALCVLHGLVLMVVYVIRGMLLFRMYLWKWGQLADSRVIVVWKWFSFNENEAEMNAIIILVRGTLRDMNVKGFR